MEIRKEKARKEKNRTRYSTFILNDYLNDMDKMCASIKVKKTRFLDKSLKLAFDLYNENKYEFLQMSEDITDNGNYKKSSYSTSLDRNDISKIEDISVETGLNKYQIINKGISLLLDKCKEDYYEFFNI